jgi:hypothetical protein
VDGDDLGQVGRCTRCGGVLRLKLPMSLKAAVLYMHAFVEEHTHCTDSSGERSHTVKETIHVNH